MVGLIKIALFIPTAKSCGGALWYSACFKGDDRKFSRYYSLPTGVDCYKARARIWINFDERRTTLKVTPTCKPSRPAGRL
ncbi:MAG: hypothetical protein M3N29_01960 [Chloroflexota bacterium]|nr:hypothetical protein [Chloroflexota bacterium]